MRALIATVGYRNLSDLSVGPRLLPQLQSVDWGPGVEVEDLSYGPLAVVQNLEDRPRYDRMVFVSAARRDRQPACLYRYRWDRPLPPTEEIRARINEALMGVISLDNLLVIAQYFGVLAAEVTVMEVEPLWTESGQDCSAPVQRLFPDIVERVKTEVKAAFCV